MGVYVCVCRRTNRYTLLASKTLFNVNIKSVFINLVILKIRSKRTQRNTEMPRGDMIFVSTRMVSRIPPHTTKLSNRLKSETKYACGKKVQLKSTILTGIYIFLIKFTQCNQTTKLTNLDKVPRYFQLNLYS